MRVRTEALQRHGHLYPRPHPDDRHQLRQHLLEDEGQVAQQAIHAGGKPRDGLEVVVAAHGDEVEGGGEGLTVREGEGKQSGAVQCLNSNTEIPVDHMLGRLSLS